MRIFAGAQGTIDGQEVVTYTGLNYGDRVTFDIGRVVLEDDSKYYVRGIRESGLDNDTAAAPSIRVTGDLDYVVAYGIPGSTVAYTVNYEDAAGGALHPSATYYGNVGDKPVVAFQYIEGYQPQAYNLTKTLSANAADNVFTFVYSRVGAGAGTGENPGAVPGGTPTTAPGGNPGVPEPSAAVPPENTPAQPPAEVGDLDDPETPLGPGASAPPDVSSDASSMPTPVKVAIGAGVVILVGVAAWLLFFRKKHEEKKNDG